MTALAVAAADPFQLYGPELPTRADLDAATAATQAAAGRLSIPVRNQGGLWRRASFLLT